MSLNYLKLAQDRLQGLKGEGRYREFLTLERPRGTLPHGLIDGRPVTIWCSNDYLGMSQHPVVLEAQHAALDQYGAGAGGTRNIAGTTPFMAELEERLAWLYDVDAALVCSSGYVANQAGLGTLAAMFEGCVVFSDEKNHASMIHGIKDSKAAKHIFRHNDMADLEAKLKATPIDTPKLIAIESVYSMDGSVAPLKEVRDLAKQYNALTYVDEVHAVGLYGTRGSGQIEAQGLSGEFDVIEGTFGKAYGGYGGFLAGRGPLIDAIRSFAAPFIFTTALPPAVLAGNLASVNHLALSRVERAAHSLAVNYTKDRLIEKGLPILNSASHIVPVMINCPHRCKDVGAILLRDHGIYVQPINYPTVPKGAERLRLTPSARHRPAHVMVLADALLSVWAALDLQQAA